MKKLLIILLIFASCSTQTIKEEEECVEEVDYFLGLREICGEGLADVFEVEKETYLIFTASHKFNCDSWFTIPDIEGNLHEGYYQQNGKNTKTCP